MTDDRRLEIERRFDGELDEPGASSHVDDLADDPEARRHLDRLSLLRELALRHNPAALAPRRAFDLPDRRPQPVGRWLAVASIVAAAAAVALLCWPGARGLKSPRIDLVERPGKTMVRPVDASSSGRPPLEVALYGWANTPSRTPKQAARLVLSPGSPSKKRSPADEILALELANASPQPRGGVQRFAVSKGSKPSPTPKSSPTNPRARTTLPEV